MHRIPEQHLLDCAKDICRNFDNTPKTLFSNFRIEANAVAPHLGPEDRQAALIRLANRYYLSYTSGHRYVEVSQTHRGYLGQLFSDTTALSKLAAPKEVKPPVTSSDVLSLWERIKKSIRRKKT